jgi:hypothetical protein
MLILNRLWTFASEHHKVRCRFSLKKLMHSNAADIELPQFEEEA